MYQHDQFPVSCIYKNDLSVDKANPSQICCDKVDLPPIDSTAWPEEKRVGLKFVISSEQGTYN